MIYVAYFRTNFLYKMRRVVQFNSNIAWRSVGIGDNQGGVASLAEIINVITGKTTTRITGATTSVVTFVTIFLAVTVFPVVDTGICTPGALPTLAFIHLGAVKPIIADGTISLGLDNTLIDTFITYPVITVIPCP
jgi:hypothetical protein